jgi:hypothetical protein
VILKKFDDGEDIFEELDWHNKQTTAESENRFEAESSPKFARDEVQVALSLLLLRGVENHSPTTTL